MKDSKPDKTGTVVPLSPLGQLRHEVSMALSSVETGFHFLTSGTSQNAEKAKNIHQNGVTRLWMILSRIDQMETQGVTIIETQGPTNE